MLSLPPTSQYRALGVVATAHPVFTPLTRANTFLVVTHPNPVTLSGLTARVIPTAAVERALFHRARSGSKGMPWL